MASSSKLTAIWKTVLLLLLVSLTASCLRKFQIGKANLKTVTVPDDYPTIADAVGNAEESDTIFVKKGNYEGPLNQTLIIDKSIHLVGEDINSTKMSLHPPLVPMSIFTYTYMGYAEPIRITASDVEISGFTIITAGGDISVTGSGTRITGNMLGMGVSVTGNGIKIIGNIINQSSAIRISGDNNVISQNSLLEGWTSFISCTGSFNFIEGNRMVRSTSSESIDIDGSFNVVYGNTLTDCGSIAVGAPPVSVECEGNIIAKNNLFNSSGIFIRGSSNIICANRITNSIASLEIFWGNNNTFYANHVANNTFGARVGFDQSDISRQGGPTAAQNTLYHNNFINNGQQGIDWNWVGTNYWDKGKEGNYWSDYTGGDWNFDGIGDISYKLSEAISSYAPSTQSEDNYPLMEPFDIETVTVELPKWAAPLTSTSASPTPTGNNPLSTTLLVALAIIACVFGFGLILNLVAGKKKEKLSKVRCA
jgi:nitrous oxidase accessory protein NosD